ncbi:MAG: single-stranded DNA-binding protein [Myxococcota bacterium]
MNVACIAGNLGNDPELRYTASGTAILRLRVATSERRKRGEQWEDCTEWHSVAVFGSRAEALQKILAKGGRVAVTGRMETRSWEGRDGGKRSATSIVASDVTLLGGGEAQGAAQAEQTASQPQGGAGFAADDIPFAAVDGTCT